MTHSARTARTRTVRREFLHTRLRSRLLKLVYTAYVPLFLLRFPLSLPSSSLRRCLAGHVRLPLLCLMTVFGSVLSLGSLWPLQTGSVRQSWTIRRCCARTLGCTGRKLLRGCVRCRARWLLVWFLRLRALLPSGQPTTSLLQLGSTTLPATGSASTGTTRASLVGNVGTDPKTGLSCVGVEKGGDPRTDHFVPSGGDVKTDQEACRMERGGDPRTDHASLVVVKDSRCSTVMAATCPPYRPGRLASATALSNSSATASAMLAADDELSDGFPSSPACRDELPSSACEANPDGSSLLDRILQRRHSIGILRDFHSGESSESLRQLQLDQVQIVPATLIPSEVSAHQMAARSDGSLARSRVDGRPISALSLQDKVLLRKYSIPVSTDTLIISAETSLVKSERDGCTIRSEGPQRAEDILRVDQTDTIVFDAITRGSTGSLVQFPSSVSKDSELEPRRNRKRTVKVNRTGRLRSPRLLRGFRILRWILEIASSYESMALRTWFYCT